jgi:hypothetical protein
VVINEVNRLSEMALKAFPSARVSWTEEKEVLRKIATMGNRKNKSKGSASRKNGEPELIKRRLLVFKESDRFRTGFALCGNCDNG